MRIGEIAKRSGASARSVRHYEAVGLLTSSRLTNGYRDYSTSAIAAITHIRWLISAGLSAKTIRQILPCVVDKNPKKSVCERTRKILQREYERLENDVQKIKRSQRLLKQAMGS